MRQLSTLAILGFLAAGSCSKSDGLAAKDACKQGVVATCERILRCDGANGLADLGYASVDDCTVHMQAQTCAGTASDVCGPGETYHADAAQSCLNAMKDLACTSNSQPAVCEAVCTGPTSSSGGGRSGSSGGGTAGSSGSGATGSSGSGATTALQDACKNLVSVVCEKAFACGPTSKLAVALMAESGSQDECTSVLQDNCAQDTECPSGEIFQSANARQCAKAFEALPCANLDDTPPVCEQVCASSGSGGAGGTGGNGGAVATSGTRGTAGMGGSSGSGGTSSSGSAYQQFCNQVMMAFCDRCAASMGMTSQECLSASQDSCTTAGEAQLCTVGTFQVDQGQTCLETVKTTSCTEDLLACDARVLCK
jgi:uncharacterized membrane protein YgcG